jgi:hypothetical protein
MAGSRLVAARSMIVLERGFTSRSFYPGSVPASPAQAERERLISGSKVRVLTAHQTDRPLPGHREWPICLLLPSDPPILALRAL